MKSLKKMLVLISLLLSFSSLAVIREASSIKDVFRHVTPRTLVIFDLDNTVLEANQTLGTDQFFSYLVKKGEGLGLDEKSSKELAMRLATPIQPVSEVRLVERMTGTFIRDLQAKNYPVFALTARPPEWVHGTLHQVRSLNVDFSKTAPELIIYDSASTQHGLYSEGVFFLPPHKEKGDSLLYFLKKSGLRPDKIIFIDDKKSNVESVDRALTAAGIKNVEFRYGAADARVESFDANVAEFEYNYFLRFKVFLSDEVAREMMGR